MINTTAEFERPPTPEHEDGDLKLQMPSDPKKEVYTKVTYRNISESSHLYDRDIPWVKQFANGTELSNTVTIGFETRKEFPEWLGGDLYRLGPGMFDLDYVGQWNDLVHYTCDSWWHGLSMLHRFSISRTEDGMPQLNYRNRFMASGLETKLRTSAQEHCTSSGGDPNLLISQNLKQPKSLGNIDASGGNAAMSLRLNFPLGSGFELHRADDTPTLICTSNYNLVQEVDAVTLLPIRIFSYENLNPDFGGVGAVPMIQVDREKEETCHVSMKPGFKTEYRVFTIRDHEVFDPVGHLLATFTSNPSVIHSFGVTPNYIVVPVYPFKADWKFAFAKAFEYQAHLKFDDQGVTKFYVIDRHKRRVICSYQVNSFFGHTIVNSFEDMKTQTICLDISSYINDDIRARFTMENLRTRSTKSLPKSTIRRYVLPKLGDASRAYPQVTPQSAFSHRTDFTLEWAVCHPNFKMHNYSFAWGVGVSGEKHESQDCMWDTLIKADLDRKVMVEWRSDDCYPGPPVMVPAGIEDEDCGVVLSVVFDAAHGHSFLLIVDSRDLTEIARAVFPCVIPWSVSGDFKQ